MQARNKEVVLQSTKRTGTIDQESTTSAIQKSEYVPFVSPELLQRSSLKICDIFYCRSLPWFLAMQHTMILGIAIVCFFK